MMIDKGIIEINGKKTEVGRKDIRRLKFILDELDIVHVIDGMGYLDLKKDGPTVIEVPPKLQGILDDFWHQPLTDVGFVGPDKGKGGNYLILPPDYKGEKPEGYESFIHCSLPVFPAHPQYLVSTFFEPEFSITS